MPPHPLRGTAGSAAANARRPGRAPGRPRGSARASSARPPARAAGSQPLPHGLILNEVVRPRRPAPPDSATTRRSRPSSTTSADPPARKHERHRAVGHRLHCRDPEVLEALRVAALVLAVSGGVPEQRRRASTDRAAPRGERPRAAPPAGPTLGGGARRRSPDRRRHRRARAASPVRPARRAPRAARAGSSSDGRGRSGPRPGSGAPSRPPAPAGASTGGAHHHGLHPQPLADVAARELRVAQEALVRGERGRRPADAQARAAGEHAGPCASGAGTGPSRRSGARGSAAAPRSPSRTEGRAPGSAP